MGILYGRAGRLTTKNGGFRSGQDYKLPHYFTVRAALRRLSALSVP
jgi:hypothetical protein